ncbi:MAG: hypothetical protein RIS44_1559 [Pseudomonadota bacterium]|jgi:hypothetical protein
MRADRIDRRSRWTQLAAHGVLPDGSRFSHAVLQLVSGQKPGPARQAPPKFGLVRGFGHAWLRLIDRDGAVISVGFYPDETLGIAPERQPGLCMPGMLLHPDKYDRVATEQLVTTIKLSDAQFRELVHWVEGLQRQRWTEGLPFSLTHFNCVEFVAQAAAKAGVQLPAHGPLVDLCSDLGPRVLRPLWRILTKMPLSLRRTMFNWALRLLGGDKADCRLVHPTDSEHTTRLTTAKLRPLLPPGTPLEQADWPLWHTHWLRRWQKKIGTQVLPL